MEIFGEAFHFTPVRMATVCKPGLISRAALVVPAPVGMLFEHVPLSLRCGVSLSGLSSRFLNALVSNSGVDLLRRLCPSGVSSGLFDVLSVLSNVLVLASLSLLPLEEVFRCRRYLCVELKTSASSMLFQHNSTSSHQQQNPSEHLCRTAGNCGSWLPLVDYSAGSFSEQSFSMRLVPKICCLGTPIVLAFNHGF